MLTQTPHNLATCRRCLLEHGTPIRGNGGIPRCPVDSRPIAANAKEGMCPVTPQKFVIVGVRRSAATPAASPTGWAAKGPRLWAQLHRDALAGRVDAAYLLAFRRQIGCGGCQADWIKWEAANPPPVGDTAAVFAWSWKAHSAVNVRLGKPEMTLAEAWIRWGDTPGGE